MVAVTDPAQLADQQALEKRLKQSTGGKLGNLLYGDEDTLTCDASGELLPARIRDAVSLKVKLCQERLANGKFRLQWVNTSGMPRFVNLPPGFEQQEIDYGFNALMSQALRRTWGSRAVIGPGKSLVVTFDAGSVRPDTALTGDTDWSAYLMATLRLVVNAALLRKPTGGGAGSWPTASTRPSPLRRCTTAS